MTLYLNLFRALYPLPYLVSYLGIDERGRRIRMFTATLTCERATRANLASCVYEGETAPASELPPGAALFASNPNPNPNPNPNLNLNPNPKQALPSPPSRASRCQAACAMGLAGSATSAVMSTPQP